MRRFRRPGAEVFAGVAGPLARGFRAPTSCSASRSTRLETTFLATSTGCAGATPSPPGRWRSTPSATAPARGRASAHPISLTCRPIRCSRSCRCGWGGRRARVELPAGRYETIMPPSTVADMMIYLGWTMDRPRRAGGPHRVVGARRRDPGGGEAHRPAADAVLRSVRRRAWAARRSWRRRVRRRRCRCSTTGWTSAGWTGFATA